MAAGATRSAETGFATIPAAPRYLLRQATVPVDLLDTGKTAFDARDGLARVDILIADGRIAALSPGGAGSEPDVPAFDMRGGIVLPAFVELHTHLDKGHIWPRAANPDGTFMGALVTAHADREANWSAEDVARRMDFSLRCAYAYGTAAIRTHLDSRPPQDAISWPVFGDMRARWAGRIDLQAVSLVGIDDLIDPARLTPIARRVAEAGGILGGAMASQPNMREALRNVVRTAERFGLAIDLHLDETLDPASDALRMMAEEVIETGFAGPVVAGHCCSLSAQDEATARRTIDLVAKAGIAIVSLPMCNLYLQDRRAGAVTPRMRGVTLIHELRAAGVSVAVSSDNTRDPFYAYGDLDGLEVLRETVRIAHTDHPSDAAPALITRNPAAIMGLAGRGVIASGAPADLVLCRGRTWTELFARPQADRTVLRAGRPIDRTLPDYAELDDITMRAAAREA